MFCTACGVSGTGQYCAACGRRHGQQDESAGPGIVEAQLHWTESIDYESLLREPEVRRRLSEAGRGVRPGVTSEDLLAVFDAVSPIGISLGKLSEAILPIYDKLGIKSVHQRQRQFNTPVGRVMVVVLCQLAARGLTVAQVHQDHSACELTAGVPAGFITNRGELRLRVERAGASVQVLVTAHTSGQWYDFGKSKRLVDELLCGMAEHLVESQSGDPPRIGRVA